MTVDNFLTIMNDLGYSDIKNTWIDTPNIIRINFTSNGAYYRETPGLAKYYFDKDHGLLYKAKFLNGEEMGVCAIVDIKEVASIETRNAYSAYMFTGNAT